MPPHIRRYEQYRKLGMPPEESAAMAKISQNDMKVLENPPSNDMDPYAQDASWALKASGVRSAGRLHPVTAYLRRSRIPAGGLHKQEQIEHTESKSLWRKILLEPAIAGISVLSMPQQAIYRAITGTDVRKAVPTLLIPENLEKAWEDEGIQHEMIWSSDVMDEWMDGGYSEWKDTFKDDPWYSKWAAGAGLFAAEFAVDVLSDPVTYLAGIGIGKKVSMFFRAKLPAAVRIEEVIKRGYKHQNPENYHTALTELSDHILSLTKAKKAATNPKKVAEIQKRIDHYSNAFTEVSHNYQEYAAMGEFAQRIGTSKPKIKNPLPKPKKGASFGEQAAYRIQQVEEGLDEAIVAFEYMSDNAIVRHMGLGLDDTEILSEAVRRVALTGDPNVTVRNLFNMVDPASHSGELRSIGIGTKGEISREMATGARLVTAVVDNLKSIEARIVSLQTTLSNVQKAAVPAPAAVRKLSRKAKKNAGVSAAKKKAAQPDPSVIKKDLAELEEMRDRFLKAINTRKKTGEWSPELLKPLNIKLPFGPRRSLWKSDDFLDSRWGNDFAKIWGKALYPGSVTLNFPEWASANIFFREPMRVLEERMPGTWEFIQGRMKMAEAERVSSTELIRTVLQEAGVLGKMNTINKKRNRVLGELLDTPRHNKEYTKRVFEAGHTVDNVPEELARKLADDGIDVLSEEWGDVLLKHGLTEGDGLIVAHDRIRSMLDVYAKKLGYDVGDESTGYISGFLSHIVSPTLTSKGRLDPMLRGLNPNTVKKLPWFLQRRVGDDVTYDAVAVLDIYTRGVSKHLYTDPAVKELERRVTAYAAKTGDNSIERFGDLLKGQMEGRTSLVGDFLETIMGEQLTHYSRQIAATIGALTYSAALTGNPRYPIMSLLQNFNTTAAEYGVLRTLKGVAAMASSENRVLARIAGLDKQQVQMFDEFVNNMGAWAAEFRPHIPLPKGKHIPLAPSISDTEFAIRGITFHASLGAQLNTLGVKSLDDLVDPLLRHNVIAAAVRDSESINHVFGKMNRPVAMTALSKTGGALATQFLSFPFRQMETIWKHTKRDPGFLWDYLALSGQMVRIAHRVNVEIDSYVGLGFAKDSLLFDHDRAQSMPIGVIAAFMRYGSSISDIKMSSLEKQRLKEDLFKEMENLAPMVVAAKHFVKARDGILHGERRATSIGNRSLIRNVNNTPFDNELGRPEMVSLVTGLKSIQSSAHEKAREQMWHNKQQAALNRQELLDNIMQFTSDGRKAPVKLVHDANKLNRSLGMPEMSFESLSRALMEEDKKMLWTQSVRIHDSSMYHGTTYRRVVRKTMKEAQQ